MLFVVPSESSAPRSRGTFADLEVLVARLASIAFLPNSPSNDFGKAALTLPL